MTARGLSREQAAAYLGLSLSGLDSWVDRGLVPGPIPGTHRWDRKAIDRALDKRSGLSDAEQNDLDEWLARHARAS